jgi:hypothetical protein
MKILVSRWREENMWVIRRKGKGEGRKRGL